eukprot:CAMPEP_0195259542 /NCGR_PEP_ID=MMETSP0706-20130129/8023_1 /TAXON_ID=33640 /ORGANISM="Asterionellopsis glacialis, Strain CCMP134" /LENGTH=80 /DNA_ID=CAMNT_0040313055 /DNA_START=27 /DNA_END=269 /DNA_ORIENTATION=-
MKQVPKDQLLVFNVKEGWDPLCKFLGKTVPTVSFPNVNESEDLKRATVMMKIVSYGWAPFLVGTAYVSTCIVKSIRGRPR